MMRLLTLTLQKRGNNVKKLSKNDISNDFWGVVYGLPGTRKTSFAISQSQFEEISVFNFDKPPNQEYEQPWVNKDNIYYASYQFDKREDLILDPKWTPKQVEEAELNYKNEIINECLPVLSKFMEDLRNAPTKLIIVDGALDLEILIKQAYYGRDTNIPGMGYTVINSAYKRIFTHGRGKDLLFLSHEKDRYETVFDKAGRKVEKPTGEKMPAANKKIYEHCYFAMRLYEVKGEYFGKITKSTSNSELLGTEWPDPTFNFIKTLYGG